MDELTIVSIITRLIIGLFVGFTIGLTGIGGGVLVLPALSILFGLPPSASVGTASLYTSITQMMSAIRHYKLNNINFPAGLLVLSGGIPAAAITGLLLNKYAATLKGNAESMAEYEYSRQLFIATVIVMSTILLVWNLIHKVRRGSKQPPKEFTKVTVGETPGAILLGITIGFLIATTSIGGGIISIPLLILIFKLPAARAVGTSSIITLSLTGTTAIVYGRGGLVDIPTAGIMAIGSIVGVSFGSKLTLKLPEKVLQGIIITLVLIGAVAMFLKQSSL